MCLAIPSRIISIDNQMAVIDVDGVQRIASLLLLEDAAVGDYVIVHAGFAIHKIDEAMAMESLDILRQSLELANQADQSEQTGLTLNRKMG
ncbi:MAG: HypC/HybG/HupF family hydrogenase formation chaperone [Desulfatirhabdiaceae bacterium]